MRIHAAVKAEELEFRTQNGWMFEQVIPCARAQTIQHNAPGPAQQANSGGYWLPTVTVETPMVVSEPLFLVSKQSEVKNREAELTARLNDHIERLAALDKAHTALLESRNQYKEEADGRTKALNSVVAVQQKMSDSNRKLEADMAKIRQAIGDLKYFEIVGGPVSVPK